MSSQTLLRLNPELQRNLWLELSPARLVMMPVVIALILWAVYEVNGEGGVATALNAIVWLLLVLWGTRLAADSFHEEVQGRTWDTQRLAASSATSLVLGKLAGGTACAWYGAALCFVVELVWFPKQSGEIPFTILGGLMGQATSLFIAVSFRLSRQDKPGSRVFLAQLAGIVTASGLLSEQLTRVLRFGQPEFGPHPAATAGQTIWYGQVFDALAFQHWLTVFAIAWLVIGAIRLVRRDLGYRDGPLAWLAFTLFMLVLAGGFLPPPLRLLDGGDLQQRMVYPLLMAVVVFYLGLLTQPVTALKLRKLRDCLSQRDGPKLWRELPGWLVTLALFLCLLPVLATTARGAELTLAILGFLLRDTLLVYGCRLRFTRRSAGLIGILAFLLYVVGTYACHPIESLQTGETGFVSIFLPLTKQWSGVAWPWIEALAAGLLFLPVFSRVFRQDASRGHDGA